MSFFLSEILALAVRACGKSSRLAHTKYPYLISSRGVREEIKSSAAEPSSWELL